MIQSETLLIRKLLEISCIDPDNQLQRCLQDHKNIWSTLNIEFHFFYTIPQGENFLVIFSPMIRLPYPQDKEYHTFTVPTCNNFKRVFLPPIYKSSDQSFFIVTVNICVVLSVWIFLHMVLIQM